MIGLALSIAAFLFLAWVGVWLVMIVFSFLRFLAPWVVGIIRFGMSQMNSYDEAGLEKLRKMQEEQTK